MKRVTDDEDAHMTPITDDGTHPECREEQLMDMLYDRIHGRTISLSDEELVSAVGSLPLRSHGKQFMIAMLFYHGIGVVKSMNDAKSHLTESAYEGFPDALFALAEAYQYGLFGKKDIFRAAKYYRKVADLDDIGAGILYAEMCLEIYQQTKIEFFADEAIIELWDKAYTCDDANEMLAICFMRGTAGEVSFKVAKEQIDYLESMGHDVKSLRREYSILTSKNNDSEPDRSGYDDMGEMFDSASGLGTIRYMHLKSYLRRTGE